jgi:hypothetical protein
MPIIKVDVHAPIFYFPKLKVPRGLPLLCSDQLCGQFAIMNNQYGISYSSPNLSSVDVLNEVWEMIKKCNGIHTCIGIERWTISSRRVIQVCRLVVWKNTVRFIGSNPILIAKDVG